MLASLWMSPSLKSAFRGLSCPSDGDGIDKVSREFQSSDRYSLLVTCLGEVIISPQPKVIIFSMITRESDPQPIAARNVDVNCIASIGHLRVASPRCGQNEWDCHPLHDPVDLTKGEGVASEQRRAEHGGKPNAASGRSATPSSCHTVASVPIT